MNQTLQFYNENAASFTQNTVDVEFSKLQDEFISCIPARGSVLDCGCGSGRDSRKFLKHGYRVVAIDGSAELAKLASAYIGQDVIVTTFQEYEPDQTFDGIWACASLLHLPLEDIEKVMRKLSDSLADGGCFYASFKYGTYSGERNGRFFTDMTEDRMKKVLEQIPALKIRKMFLTTDARPDRKAEMWLNVFLVKKRLKK